MAGGESRIGDYGNNPGNWGKGFGLGTVTDADGNSHPAQSYDPSKPSYMADVVVYGPQGQQIHTQQRRNISMGYTPPKPAEAPAGHISPSLAGSALQQGLGTTLNSAPVFGARPPMPQQTPYPTPAGAAQQGAPGGMAQFMQMLSQVRAGTPAVNFGGPGPAMGGV